LCNVEGENATYGLRLDTKPFSDVTVTPLKTLVNSSSRVVEPTQIGTLPKVSLTFTPSNWDIIQPITVFSIDDRVDNDNLRYKVVHKVQTSDAVFRAAANLQDTVSLIQVIDDDTAKLHLLETTVLQLDEKGDPVPVVIAGLNTRPVADVVVTVRVNPNYEHARKIGLNPARFVVTQANWNSANFSCNVMALGGIPVDQQRTGLVRTELWFETTSIDEKYNTIETKETLDVIVKLESPNTPAPSQPIAKPIADNPKALRMSWSAGNAHSFESNWAEFELQWSANEAFPGQTTNSTSLDFQYDPSGNYFMHTINTSKRLPDQVVYTRVRKIANPVSAWSPTSKGWIVAPQCDLGRQYLNTSLQMELWSCQECPEGANCLGEYVTWKEVKPLFGWWRNKVWEPFLSSNFSKCLYPPACLGSPNPAFRAQFKNEDGEDIALLNSLETCNPDLGYAVKCDRDSHVRCRLCGTCERGYRRRNIGGALRCDKCPSQAANKGLIALGALLIGFVLGLMLFNHMGTGGKKSLAQMQKVIIINYLQTTYIISNMDVPWPDTLSTMFEFQGAISTIGEQLINPVCELQTISAADLLYSKQVCFAFAVPLLGTCIFFAWRSAALCQKRSFTYRGPNGRSPSLQDGCTATMVFLMYLMYPTLCRQAFALFMCKDVGGHQYLMADLQEACWEGRHMLWVLFCSLPQIVLHVIGFPVIGLFVIHRRKKVRRHDHDKSFSGLKQISLKNNLASSISLFKFGMLYSAYAPHRWYWDAVIAFKKASIAFVTSFVSTPELEVHWIVALMGSFVILNEFGKPYNHLVKPVKKRKQPPKPPRLSFNRQRKLKNEARKVSNSPNGNRDVGAELQRLDSLSLYVSMMTSWSGLFFILFPYCSKNDIGCGLLLVCTVLTNALFMGYCVTIFRHQIVSDTKRLGKILYTSCSCCRKVDPAEVLERKQKAKIQKAVEMRRSDVHGNPLLYRKSFVLEQSTTNPLVKLNRSVMTIKALRHQANIRRSKQIKEFLNNRQTQKRNEEHSIDEENTWETATDENGNKYRYNLYTGESKWDMPSFERGDMWDTATDEFGETYYYHKETNEVRWDAPCAP
jgi:hypothetical protein